tara:strand:- start:1511 stop:1984 length:474 start_codon:yes stop_codon:yes gene_type:complete
MVSTYLKNNTSNILVCIEVLTETALALIIFSAFCCWQSVISGNYDFYFYLIYFVSVWSIQQLITSDDYSVFLLASSLFYDSCFGFYFAYYTLGLLVYATWIRGWIYSYVIDGINQIFFMVGYLVFLYICSWGVMGVMDCYQSAMQPWVIKSLAQTIQ